MSRLLRQKNPKLQLSESSNPTLTNTRFIQNDITAILSTTPVIPSTARDRPKTEACVTIYPIIMPILFNQKVYYITINQVFQGFKSTPSKPAT